MGTTYCYTKNSYVMVPHVEFQNTPEGCTLVPICGYTWFLAVAEKATKKFLGYVDTKTLGYKNALEWVKMTGWKDEGY